MSKTVRNCLAHLSVFALSLSPLIPVAAHAKAAPVLPSGGIVAVGQAGIAAGGSSLTISQGSAKAIIDWGSFSIGAGATVRFDNGAGATLNRVTGAGLSSIDGLLSASGSVYLLNPNGVIIGKSGVVDVGGTFVASTLGLGDGAFLSGGDLTFTGPSNASVINLGHVGALGGDVVLTASKVRNEGAITASRGDVGLLAGSQVLLRDQALDGGRFAVLVGGTTTSVTNSGSIAGAMAELRANGGDVYALAGDTRGVIRATGVSAEDGRVFLTAGDPGSVTLGGTITARGLNRAGGAIETSASTVTIGSARIDAGPGGSWLLDPNDLTIDQTAANTIAATLNGGTSVTQQTTASGAGGSGDITVASNVNLSWTTNAGLTLSSYRNINLGSASLLESTAGGAVTLAADDTGTGTGTVNFGSSAKISTSGKVSLTYNPASNPTGSAVNATSYTNPTNYGGFVGGGAQLTAAMLVNTSNDLQNIQNNLSGHYALGADIQFPEESNQTFSPIGSIAVGFSGSLDGRGHVVEYLNINQSGVPYVGLFSSLSGVVSNLRFTDPNISGGAHTGVLAGDSTGVLTNISVVRGSVKGGDDTGGIVGSAAGQMTSLSFAGTVQGGNATGGLVGDSAASALLVDSLANAGVSGGIGVGGLIGVSEAQGTGTTQASSTILNGYSTSSVYGTSAVGGLVGDNAGSVANAYASGQVVGSSATGGVVGQNESSALLTNAYWDVGTSRQASGIGVNQGLNNKVLGLGGSSGSSPYASATYVGFDFSDAGAWVIFDGATRPLLRSEASSTITNAHQLQLIDLNRSGAYALADNIDLTNATYNPSDVWNTSNGFVPIASRPGATDPFTGSLDGRGYTISYLTIISTYNNVGLFGNIGATGSVSNLKLFDVNVTGANDVGGLVGQSLGTISGVTIGGNVSGQASVGGLIGSNLGTIANSNSAVVVAGAVNCSVCQFAGGLVGYSNGNIVSSIATGAVSGYQYVGGLAGRVLDVSDSYATGAVTGVYHDIGGLVGQAFGHLSDDYATGVVIGQMDQSTNIGGLVGYLNGSGVVSSSYASGSVSGLNGVSIGGLIGASDGTISNDYAIGSASGNFAVGGLVGQVNGGSIQSVYATGAVAEVPRNQMSGPVGGLIGSVGPYGPALSNVYWDVGTTHQSAAVGPGDAVSESNVVGVGGGATASNPGGASPYAQSTYAGFDFSTNGAWTIFDGYTRPILRSEASSTIINAHQLQLIGANLAGTFTLGVPIDLSVVHNQNDIWNPATGFVPIGSPSSPFTGSFNGLGLAISGLYINRPAVDGVGMFGVVGPLGQVSEADLVGVSVTGRYYTGALIGDNYGAVSVGDVSGSVTGIGGVGGLIGVGEVGSSVQDAAGDTSTPPVVQCGSCEPTIQYVSVNGAGDDVGGVMGVNLGAVNYVTSGLGGIAGHINVGGVVGLNVGSITAADGAANVTGYDSVGGVVGLNVGTVIQSSSENGSAMIYRGVAGYAGGLVGRNASGASITDSYASEASNVAGLVGRNDGTVTRAYANGAVGAAGAGVTALNTGTLTDVLWNVALTGTNTGVASGAGSNISVLPLGGSTGRDPLLPSSYPNFDFTKVWYSNGDNAPGLFVFAFGSGLGQ